MADKQTDSTAPQTASSPQGKIQPWRSFWPLQDESSARTFTEVNNASSENAAKYWYTLERGGLIAEQEKKLAVVMQKTFDNKPCYTIHFILYIGDNESNNRINTNDSMDLVPDMASASAEWDLCDEKITTPLKFLAPSPRWLTEKPFCLSIPLPEGQPRSNTITCTMPNSMVGNVRGMESLFQLDKNGFEFSSLPPLPRDLDFDDHAVFEAGYLQDMADFLKKKLKADAVFVFDYTRRCSVPPPEGLNKSEVRLPGTVAHIDQTPMAALGRAQLHLGENCEKYLKGRMQLINIWRPLIDVIEESPLAFCDSRTVSSADLVAADLVYPHHIGEKYDVLWGEDQRWYYLDKMRSDECVLIKMFDSQMDGRARGCPHQSFRHPATRANAPPRESLELRCMVFHSQAE
ncbi:hypothetical protein V500_08633 [Pseudogymnoascus sp. VKM F-4518 (FW-2643)]|nr:hypothetical protein V500_08633 [Pseudogymnoascus sp. VKM F-4518 (FW-2643)]